MEEPKQESSPPLEENKKHNTINSSSSSLKLLGSWASSYTHRVQLALKLKNLPFSYTEEDLSNKSPTLLLHNPIYKKVPVLLSSDGRPIPESLIILHFLDESFPDASPRLLPSDPYDRSAARFWAHFADDRLSPSAAAAFASTGDAQRAAVDRFRADLALLEAELSGGAFAGRRFFGGDGIGFLDIVVGCGSYWLAVFEEVADVKLVDAEEFPRFHAWLRDFEGHEEVKAIIPPFDRLLEYARGVRQTLLGTAAAAAGATENGGGHVAEV